MGRVVIADSHILCRQALCDYIRGADTDITVYEAGHYTQLCAIARAAKPDLVILESGLPGFETRDIAPTFENARIAYLISHHGDDSCAQQAERSDGIFRKSISCKDFLSGIHDILEGKRYFPVLDERHGVMFAQTEKPSMEDYHLTVREREVLYHLMRGASNKDIARSLNLQVVTVKLHVRGICRKLKAANRTQAALIALENGWA